MICAHSHHGREMGIFFWTATVAQVLTLILGSLAVVMDSWWASDTDDVIKTGLWYPCHKKCGAVIAIRIAMTAHLVPAICSSCCIVAYCTRLLPKHDRYLLKTATNCSLLQVLLIGISLFLSWKTQSSFGSAFTVAWSSECVAITTFTMLCLLYKDHVTSSDLDASDVSDNDDVTRERQNQQSPHRDRAIEGPPILSRA